MSTTTTTTKHRPGFPGACDLARARHRLICGEPVERIAADLGRRTETLQRWLSSPQHAPPDAARTYTLTTRRGARIEGLTLGEVRVLARTL